MSEQRQAASPWHPPCYTRSPSIQMLSIIRGMSRMLSTVLLVALIAPAALPECRPMAGAAPQGMDCCHRSVAASAASLDADCCALMPDTPAPVQPTTPATATRTVDPSAAALANMLPAPLARPSLAVAAVALDTSPPQSLYLRLSTIRR